MEDARGEVKGKINLAASSTPGAYLVPRLLKRFQECYPATETTLLVGDSKEVLSWLNDYRVPLAVVGQASMADGLVRAKIGTDELRLMMAANDSLTHIAEIRDEHLIDRTLFIREQGSSTRAGAESLLGSRLEAFARIVELNNSEAIKQSVVAGLGVAVLSSWATVLEESAGLLSLASDTRMKHERHFYLVRREDRPLTGTSAALWHYFTSSS